MTEKEVIRENLADILGVEQHALQRIERQRQDERIRKFEKAYEALEKIEVVLNSHIGELERHLSTVDGGFEAKLKRAATSIAGSVASVYDRIRTNEPVSKNLRDDYVLLNLAVIDYGMLHTAALMLSETQIAPVAQRHMTDLTPLIVELSDIIPFVLAGELGGKENIEDGAARQAAAQYRQAWSSDVTARVRRIEKENNLLADANLGIEFDGGYCYRLNASRNKGLSVNKTFYLRTSPRVSGRHRPIAGRSRCSLFQNTRYLPLATFTAAIESSPLL